ncbi:MAG: hypothetical protein GX826_02975 [Gammaproteobacteria bacterium]|nr:hypothetical protein [Gammaproteobacteria bacterium]
MRSDLASRHPADATEALLPDVDAAAALLLARRPGLLSWLARWRRQLVERFGTGLDEDATRANAALIIGLARMGLRHGSWGDDFHAYHNEDHALELLDRRLGRLAQETPEHMLGGRDWIALALFAVCHDLRQRETGPELDRIGANEAASMAECARILAAAGFDPARDAWLYRTLDLAIAGSTFDARPLPPDSRSNTAERAAHGGPLAPHLASWLDETQPGWREDPLTLRALALAQVASDLDTANVAEPLMELAASSIRLCEEREMRAGRNLDAAESAAPCLAFLTDGQERYFFELHRFCSEPGRHAFSAGKAANAEPLRAIVAALRDAHPDGPKPGQDGRDLIREFARLALHFTG